MHYAIVALISSLLLMVSSLSLASNDNILKSPYWLNVQPKLLLAQQQQNMYFEAKQSHYLWLEKGQWLELENDTFSSFIYSSGTSQIAQQRLNQRRDFICEQDKCQLPSTSYNRVIKISNHLDDAEYLSVMVGEKNRHKDSFRRAIKLPRQATRLRYGQNVEHYYHFKAGDTVKLFFQNAKKLKITVRKDLLNKDINGKVYAYINDQPAAIVGVLASRASEFHKPHIGLANTEYLAVGKGEYLTLKSETDAYIKLEQNHRAIYDDLAMDKQQEALFQPYWVNNLNNTLTQIYQQRDLSLLDPQVYRHSDLLAQRRYLDLLKTISTSDYLLPLSNESDSFTSYFKHFDSLSGVRLVDDIGYPILTEEYAQVHQLAHQKHFFSLDAKQRVKQTITFHARSEVDTQLLVKSGNQQWQLNLLKSENFATFELNIPLTASGISIQNLQQQRHPIEYVLQSDRLLDLPNNELLYAQPGLLTTKSKIIDSLIKQQLTQAGDEFLSTLVPYNPVLEPNSFTSFDSMHWQHQLGEAQYLAKTDPLQALLVTKKLVSVPSVEIAIKAWQLRITILIKQGRSILAKSYLEGLFKSSDKPALKYYAGGELLKQYQALGQDYKLQGLCANALTELPACRNITIDLAIKQQKNLFALWLSHDLTADDELNSSFKRLNWRDYNNTQTQQQLIYGVEHSGQQTLTSSAAIFQAFTVTRTQGITFKAVNQPMTIALRARSESVQNGQYKMSWLYTSQGKQQSLLPIFSDVSSTTALKNSGELLSIASESLLTLKVGESIRLTSDHPTFVTYKVIPAPLVNSFNYQNMATPHYWQTPFMSLLYDSSVDLKSLLNNTLFKLAEKTLSINEFTQVLAKVHALSLPVELESLYSRVQSYGEWEAVPEYEDFAGTQLIAVDSLSQASYSDQLARASSQEGFNNGLVLRPLHSMYIDLSQTRSQQLRLNFNFSSAELSQGNIANVALNLGDSEKTWSVQPDKITSFGFNKSELNDSVISLRWLNPYLSQIMTVNAQEYRDNTWQDLPLANNLLFYTVLPDAHLIAKLPADRLVKLEQMQLNIGEEQVAQRTERTFFHPAGKVEVSTDKLKYVRLYTWQLSKSNHKISNYKAPTKVEKQSIVYQLPESEKSLQTEVARFSPDDLSWQAFINYDRRGIFESSEDIATQNNIDVGARFRLISDENWYRLDLSYSISESDKDTIAVDMYHSWQDHDSPWYVDSALKTRWQPSTQGADSQYSVSTSVQVGQIWRIDESHRHQWQVSPFYNYSSANIDDLLLDPTLSSDIYSFYREDHPYGWRGEYQYRYQPWVDSYFNFLAGSTSNSDWTSLDSLRFGTSWTQYYQGHIFQAGLTSYYKFADKHRPNNTWQYITSLGWRKQVPLGSLSQGWVKLRWDQDWFRNDHNISLEFSTGNLDSTGFEVFSHDEIIFESLQLNHFLEQN
ncbi:hypothetical protein [Pseudoalteromonas porphyrae]|uniref:Uncharacterized protein n=1 Tax=Pseudoalteromonas porphyrae TaxID=187330 RepID=A0A0N0M113_9GAMM|nr:hypothetical protein [Pseudoalteromonas porphyrae]KPH64691.1 hypothetical protein ADS77_05350 [Pseudoalteromonas porphyrae]